MCPLSRYPILRALFKPFRLSQQKTLATFVAAIVERGTTASFALSAHVAAERHVELRSALRRLQRLLRNPRIRTHDLTVSLLRFLSRRRAGPLVLALDWTKWTGGREILVAAAIVGKRAVPVRAAAYVTSEIMRSQNARENFFVARLHRALEDAGTSAILLCDRGFRRASLLIHLERLDFPFVVRLMSDVWVHAEGGEAQALRAHPLTPGTAVDLGPVLLRQDEIVTVRVVGIWARGQAEPWWLATNLYSASLSALAALYDRRMGVEEQFRDTKGCRFGVRLKWSQIQAPSRLSRLLLLTGAAVLIWTAVGAAVRSLRPNVQMPSKKKGDRLSLVHVGIFFLAELMRRKRRLTASFILQYLPPPHLRLFPWLQEVGS